VNPTSVAAAVELGALVVHGDGTEDADLEKAGLSPRAGARRVCGLGREEPLHHAVGARRPVGRLRRREGIDDSAARKLRLAGADRVVQPYSAAGVRMATLVLKPQVADYLDIVSSAAGGGELLFEEITLDPSCEAAGRELGLIGVEETGAMIVALRHGDGSFVTAPAADTVLAPGDVLIGVGSVAEIDRLERLFAPREVGVG
jgi:voltage-gated potassium channel